MRFAFINITPADNITISEHQTPCVWTNDVISAGVVPQWQAAIHRNFKPKKKKFLPRRKQCLHYEDQLLRLRREIIAVSPSETWETHEDTPVGRVQIVFSRRQKVTGKMQTVNANLVQGLIETVTRSHPLNSPSLGWRRNESVFVQSALNCPTMSMPCAACLQCYCAIYV